MKREKLQLNLLILWLYYALFSALKPSILIIGGSGRVGGAACRELFTHFQDKYTLSIGWESVDVQNERSVEAAIRDYDLIIHTAGPFQGLKEPLQMKEALKKGKRYVDVCDDINLSRIARSPTIKSLAKENNGVAVISTGIWPGVSSILAKKLSDSLVKTGDEVETLEFSFFTAGSGGAGPTILTATFLILGEDVLTYEKGKPVYINTGRDTCKVDFGPVIGKRKVISMNLIECESAHQAKLAKTINTKFGTAPPFWNTLFLLMVKVTPQQILQDRNIMSQFATFSLPLVRTVDRFVGAANGIRIDCTCRSRRRQTALLTHHDLEKCVGEAIASFANELMSSTDISPDIYFPEKLPLPIREKILSDLIKTSSYYNFNYETHS